MSATSATFRQEALKSATVTETPKSELAAPPDPTKPGPGFVGYDEEGRFVHYCACGEWGSFGYNVSLRTGLARHVVLPGASTEWPSPREPDCDDTSSHGAPKGGISKRRACHGDASPRGAGNDPPDQSLRTVRLGVAALPGLDAPEGGRVWCNFK